LCSSILGVLGRLRWFLSCRGETFTGDDILPKAFFESMFRKGS